MFSDGTSLSTTCGEKVCRLQKHHEMCKWPISEGKRGSRRQATREIGTKTEQKIRKREKRGRREW